MIQTTTTHICPACGSTNLVRNGHNRCGTAQGHCLDCGAYRALNDRPSRWAAFKVLGLKTYRERASLRGLGRIFAVPRQNGTPLVAGHLAHRAVTARHLAPASA